MSEMFCTFANRRDDVLLSYLYEELDAAARAEFDAHLASCVECREELDACRSVRRKLAAWTPPSSQP